MGYPLNPTPGGIEIAERPSGYVRTPEEKIATLERRLADAGDQEGLLQLHKHRARLLQELHKGVTRCLTYYDAQVDALAVRDAGDAVRILDMRSREQEELWVLCLDSKHRVLARTLVHKGTLDTVKVWLRDVFRDAVRLNSAAILVAHNHPSSGEPMPSPSDNAMTDAMQAAAKLLGIDFLDHVVIGRYGHYSYAEANKILLPRREPRPDRAHEAREAPPVESLWLHPRRDPLSVRLDRWADYPYFLDSLRQYGPLPESVEVRWGAYQDFTQYGFDDASDWDFVDDVAARMRDGEDVPPLIREKGRPSDGIHRAFSARSLQIRKAPVVELVRPPGGT